MDDLTGIREEVAKLFREAMRFGAATEQLITWEDQQGRRERQATELSDQILALFAPQVRKLTEERDQIRRKYQVALDEWSSFEVRAQAAEAQALALREAGEKALGGFRRVASILSNSELHEHTRICDARDEAIFARQALSLSVGEEEP